MRNSLRQTINFNIIILFFIFTILGVLFTFFFSCDFYNKNIIVFVVFSFLTPFLINLFSIFIFRRNKYKKILFLIIIINILNIVIFANYYIVCVAEDALQKERIQSSF